MCRMLSLAAMTFPDVFSSTAFTLSAVVGVAVAILLAYFEKGLLTVALSVLCAASVYNGAYNNAVLTSRCLGCHSAGIRK